ncbi:MAG: hypothetical protein NXY57DRAFT_1043430 [Lentinula lateritia]|nr:MAG: hypothetical protein NXY57DRAFT_1043430 [Lentinula lateritia]
MQIFIPIPYVGVVWCIEFIHQTLVAHTAYHYLVLCFGSPIIILTEPLVWSFVTLIVVGTVSESIVKFCFIIRIWRFSNHNKMVTTALSMLVFAEIGWILGNVMCHFRNQNTDASPKKSLRSQLQNALGLASIKYVASGGLATGALGDILLALAMCYYLRKWRTGYQEPDSLLNNLVQYALNTGVMTSTLGVLTLILYDTSTSNFQYMGVHLVLSKSRVGDEFTETNDGLGSLTTLTELARNVNVNPVEVTLVQLKVNVQQKTRNAGDQVYEVFDEHLRFQPLPPSKRKFEPNRVQRST